MRLNGTSSNQNVYYDFNITAYSDCHSLAFSGKVPSDLSIDYYIGQISSSYQLQNFSLMNSPCSDYLLSLSYASHTILPTGLTYNNKTNTLTISDITTLGTYVLRLTLYKNSSLSQSYNI